MSNISAYSSQIFAHNAHNSAPHKISLLYFSSAVSREYSFPSGTLCFCMAKTIALLCMRFPSLTFHSFILTGQQPLAIVLFTKIVFIIDCHDFDFWQLFMGISFFCTNSINCHIYFINRWALNVNLFSSMFVLVWLPLIFDDEPRKIFVSLYPGNIIWPDSQIVSLRKKLTWKSSHYQALSIQHCMTRFLQSTDSHSALCSASCSLWWLQPWSLPLCKNWVL